jgi:hypothetical protein
MVQIHSPRPILLEPMSYSNQKSLRPLGRGPGAWWFKSTRYVHAVAAISKSGADSSFRPFRPITRIWTEARNPNPLFLPCLLRNAAFD